MNCYIALVEWMVYNAPSCGIGVHCGPPEISKEVGFTRSILKLELCLFRLIRSQQGLPYVDISYIH